MAKRKGTTVKTKVGDLKYVFITGEGKNNAMPGEEPRMQYTATLVCEKDGEIHKHFHDLVYKEWEDYKKFAGIKGLPGLNKHGEPMDGMKIEMAPCESGEIDPQTEEVKKVPTGNVLITFKTNTKWTDGNAQVIKVFDKSGKDITNIIQKANWTIGEGSRGVIHGTAQGNDTGGSPKVTLYLKAVQLANLVKYEGDTVDTEEIEGDDLDLDSEDAVAGIEDEGTQPNL